MDGGEGSRVKLGYISVENSLAVCVHVCVIGIVSGLCRGSFEGSPGVEAAREAVRLVPLPHQPKLPRLFCFLGAHVLDVNLAGFETEFDLHLASLGTNPHVHLFAVIQQHDVIISQVILAEV